MQGTVNPALIQRSTTRGDARAFEIHNDKYLRVSTQTLRGRKQFHINLAVLEPRPRQHRRLAWRWLGAAAASGLVAGGTLLAVQRGGPTTALLALLLLSALATLGALLTFIYRSPNVAEFRSRHGNCVLFSLMHRRPDRQRYEAFVHELTERIAETARTLRLSHSQMLAGELKTLRRLTDEGVLTETEYAAAKQRIFRLHDRPPAAE